MSARWLFETENFTRDGHFNEAFIGDDETGLILARLPPGPDTEKRGRLMAAAPNLVDALLLHKSADQHMLHCEQCQGRPDRCPDWSRQHAEAARARGSALKAAGLKP